MKKIMALMIGLLVMGLAFAVAQEETEDPKADLKVQSLVKNAAATKPMLRHRVQWIESWVDADADGIADDGETTAASPKGAVTPLTGPGAKTWDPYKALDVVETTEPTTVSDIDLVPEDTETVESDAVTITKSSFRLGLSSTGLTEGAGVPKGAAVKAIARKRG